MPPLPKEPKVLKKIFIRLMVFIPNIIMGLLRAFLSLLRPTKPCIYFCYNQSIHQIHHTLFVALELSRIQDKFDVVILSTSAEASRIIEDELAAIPNRAVFKKIRHFGYSRSDFDVNWFVFYCWLKMANPAAVVVPDYYDNVFRKLGLKTCWVYMSHGVANRRFSFDAHVRDYDFVIAPGQRDAKMFKEQLGELKNIEVLGYSKFDLFHYHRVAPRILFKDLKPTLLYNPHFDEKLTSFFDQGLALLKALSESGLYNVIFMPHPDLSRKHPHMLDEAAKIPGVVLIVRPITNLEYMATSDLYITDISSSVFEWFYFNKPVVFFNTKKVDWKSDPYYTSWVSGEVAIDVPGMLEAIDHSLKLPGEHEGDRRRLFNETFFNSGGMVSKDIATAIYDMVRV